MFETVCKAVQYKFSSLDMCVGELFNTPVSYEFDCIGVMELEFQRKFVP